MSNPQLDPQLDRRTVVRTAGVIGLGAAGAVGLAACGSSDSSTGTAAAPAATTPAAATSTGGASGTPAADVPVGGGKIVGAVVITQPTKDVFKAFSAICTHKGCPVSKVENGHIVCPCHGSMFDLTTGAPTPDSPAKQPLAPKTATVSGTDVVVS